MLSVGDLVPHFTVKTLDGSEFSYSQVWQKRNLVMVTLPATPAEPERDYLLSLDRVAEDFQRSEAAFVLTREAVPGLPAPGVVVADRWGEIVDLQSAARVADLPRPRELAEWLGFVRNRCPECEGETK